MDPQVEIGIVSVALITERLDKTSGPCGLFNLQTKYARCGDITGEQARIIIPKDDIRSDKTRRVS